MTTLEKQIQMMICPSDIGAPNGPDSFVPGIYGHEIFQLLREIILRRKGINITFILDCCRSSAMSLFNGTTGDNLQKMLGRKASVQSKGALIILAACGRDQLAREDQATKRGYFTSNLLKIMNNELETLTYRSFMNSLSTLGPKQTPHCKGNGINRSLFGVNKETKSDTALIYTAVAKDGSITLQAGLAQGISVGTRFSAHKTDLLDSRVCPNPPLDYFLVAKSVRDFSSTLDFEHPQHSIEPDPRPPQRFYCRAVGSVPYTFHLYCKDKTWLKLILRSEFQQPAHSIHIVDDSAACNLELIHSNDTISFHRWNDVVIHHIGSLVPHAVNKADSDALRRIIDAASHFHYHRTRCSTYPDEDVRMELNMLEADTGNTLAGWRRSGDNLIKGEQAEIMVDQDRYFGITIINNSGSVLYPFLFYFDPNNLEICEIYSPPIIADDGRLDSSSYSDAPLPPKARLAIGYGDSGNRPFQFCLDGNAKDVGFIRLFLSTRPGSFQSIVQESPFEYSRGLKRSPLKEVDWWMVKTATIIQIPRAK